MIGLTSCEKLFGVVDPDDNEIIDNGNTDGDEDDEEDGKEEGNVDPLYPDEQKVKLEHVAENLMEVYPSTGFEDLMDLSVAFSERYLDGEYDWEPVFEYCEDRGYEMFFEEEDVSEKNGDIYYSWSLLSLIEMSDLYGKIVLGPTSATCQDYDGTEMVFTLDGNEYVVDMSCSGKTTVVKYTFEDIYGYHKDGYYDDNGYWVDDYVMVHYNDKYEFEVEVPENIVITVTENGDEFAMIDLDFTVSVSRTGFDITKDCLLVSLTAEIDGNEFVMEKTGYDAVKDKAYQSFGVRKDGKDVLFVDLSAKAQVELVTEREEYGDGDYYEYTYLEVDMMKDFNVSVDLLGELQIEGSCSNALSLNDYIEIFYDASSRTQVERAIDNINNCLDLVVYYDGTDVKQADVIMDYYVYEDDYYGETYYELEPIIVFPDGSKYAVYEYFDEDSFSGLIDSFELWLDYYEAMFDHYL